MNNYELIQQLIAAGKLPANFAGDQQAVAPDPIQQPPMPDPSQQPMMQEVTGSLPNVPPAGTQPTQVPFEAPMQPQQRHVQNDPVKGVKESQQGLDAAYNRQEQAMQKAASLGQQKAAEETAFNIEQDKRMSEYGQKQQAAEQERQTKTQDSMNKLSSIQEEYAGMKVDPNRYWSNRSTNGKILTAISLIFGSLGSGTTNQAVTIMQNAINQDIDLQKMAIDKKGNEVNQQKGLLNEMRTQFGDARAAEAATRTLMLDQATRQVQIIGGKFKGAEQAATMEQVMGQLEAEKQKSIGDFYKTVDDMNNKKAQLQLERDKLGLEFMKSHGTQPDDGKLMVTVRDGVNPDGTIRYTPRLARDPEAAKKARDIYSATEEVVALIDEARAFRKEKGRAWLPEKLGGTDKADATRITTQITLKLKALESMGALDAGVLKIGEMLAKNPGAISTSDATIQNTYTNFRNALMRSTNASLRQYGDDIQFTDPQAAVRKKIDFQPNR